MITYQTAVGPIVMDPYKLTGKFVDRDGWLYIESYSLSDSDREQPAIIINYTKTDVRVSHYPELVGKLLKYVISEGWYLVDVPRSSPSAFIRSPGVSDIAMRRVVAIPRPKVRDGVEVRWSHFGSHYPCWQKFLKSKGWVQA
jgi:hypothetical protein